ncbi:hypothetical protein CSQ87_00040 [Bifidobacterium simiarum]|uniref:CTP synthase n=2 Tax=Bifidobacterium simiarum TaxID=2045441 RepID=A0A2M9HGQ8_9BIFI|nr:hypothetical protein CSQ87_00040 [Bifidobacterium simiarum]
MRRNSTLDAMLDTAEANGLCLWSGTEVQRQILRRRVTIGELTAVGAQCYARTSYWQALSAEDRLRHLTRSLTLMHPKWVFGGSTAATLLNICDSTRHMRKLHRVIDGNRVPRSTGIIVNHYIEETAPIIIDGARVTPLDRTAFDCARWLGFPDAIAIIDSILRQRLRTKSQLDRSFRLTNGKYRNRALHVLNWATGRTDNGGESFSYGVILEERFMQPQLQVVMPCHNEYGNHDRVDFLWKTPDGRIIVAELDGRIKYRDASMYVNGSLPETIIAEKEREERIRMEVDGFVRFSFAEAYRRTPLIRKLEWAGVPRTTDFRSP